jgi:general secretion pathway protein D
MALRRGFIAVLIGVMASASLGAADDKQMTMELPASIDLAKFAELTSKFVNVSLQYNPQKLNGNVRMAVRGKVTADEFWTIFNQVLLTQNFTTVITGFPPVYQVVPVNEAVALSVELSPEQTAALPYKPGFGVQTHELKYINAEAAVKAVAAIFGGQVSQARAVPGEGKKIVLAASQPKLAEAVALLNKIDVAGATPTMRMFRPTRTSPQAIQSATTAAWAAFGRMGTEQKPIEIQVAPDGQQVLLIASKDDLPRLEELAKEFDRAEQSEAVSYRPRYFSIDEVASLLQEVLKTRRADGGGGPEIIKDTLTGSLIIKATPAQHERIAELLHKLDEAPVAVRRQMRTWPVKNRQADELSKVIHGLITAGALQVSANQQGNTALGAGVQATPALQAGTPPSSNNASPSPIIPLQQTPLSQDPKATTPIPAQSAASGQQADRNTSDSGANQSVVITADVTTNSLIAIGDPRSLDQVESLLKKLDRRQPQVELEVVLVTLSSNQTRDLGVELAGLTTRGEVTYSASSLFGLSTAGIPAPARTVASPSGFSGVILSPGEYAAVVRALETVSDGHSLIRSKVVVNNNAKATINGVVQEPVTSINTTNTVATTAVSGTSDAGTQLNITPNISSADYLTVTYSISQSAFLGESVVTGSGAVIPPTKRSDSMNSVATIPDGFVIAMGGLSNRSNGSSESRLPILGRVPVLGYLFKKESVNESESRFFVFIRASVLRHNSFEDLRRISSDSLKDAALSDENWPSLQPQFVDDPAASGIPK